MPDQVPILEVFSPRLTNPRDFPLEISGPPEILLEKFEKLALIHKLYS